MHPIRISPNKRYFVDADGNHVLWLGTTQWQLLLAFTLQEAQLTIAKSKAIGFDFIQAMPLGVRDGTDPNLHGERPFHDDDPASPNEAQWIDPRSGDSIPAGAIALPGTTNYTTPEGWEDALLVLEASN